MYARLVTYSTTGDPRELAKRAEEGVLPIFREQPGFRSYSLAEADGDLLSMSVWDSPEQIDAANTAAAEWVQANMAGEIEVRELRTAEVLLSTALDVRP
jgi:heme-degrading monooxygenase HmoA